MGTGSCKVEGRANRVRCSQSQGFMSFNILGWLCLSFLLLSILFFLFYSYFIYVLVCWLF